jgi:hypothetical protein
MGRAARRLHGDNCDRDQHRCQEEKRGTEAPLPPQCLGAGGAACPQQVEIVLHG